MVSSTHIFQNFSILKIKKKRLKAKPIMLKYNFVGVLKVISDLFMDNNLEHNYCARRDGDLHIPFGRSEASYRNFVILVQVFGITCHK